MDPGEWHASGEATKLWLAWRKLDREVAPLEAEMSELDQIVNANSDFGKLTEKVAELTERNNELDKQRVSLEVKMTKAIAEATEAQRLYLQSQSKLRHSQDMEAGMTEAVEMMNETAAEKAVDLEKKSAELQEVSARFGALRIESHGLEEKISAVSDREKEINEGVQWVTVDDAPDMSAFNAPIPVDMTKTEKDVSMGYDDGSDFIRNPKMGESSQRHTGPVTVMSFCSTRGLLATGGEDSVVHVMSLDGRERVARLTDAKKTIMAINFCPLDQLMLTASHDASVRIYRLAGMELVSNCAASKACVTDAKFISDNKYVTCCRNHTIKLFDVGKTVAESSLTSKSTPQSVLPIRGESLVMTAHLDGKIRAWDFRTSTSTFEFPAHKTPAIQLLTVGGSQVVSLGADRTIAITDVKQGRLVGKVNIAPCSLPSDNVQMAMRNDIAVVGGVDGDLYSFDLNSYKPVGKVQGHKSPVFCVAIDRTKGVMATGDKAGVVKFWQP